MTIIILLKESMIFLRRQKCNFIKQNCHLIPICIIIFLKKNLGGGGGGGHCPPSPTMSIKEGKIWKHFFRHSICTHNLILEDGLIDHSYTQKIIVTLHALIYSLNIIKMMLRF